MKPIKRILIIRFRQIGDSILTTALCSTLKKSFPEAEIHYVLNKSISSLYEDHPDINKVITFDKEENKSFFLYLKRVWNIVHQDKYDVIIDICSTMRTLFFSLFSLRTPFRIGQTKIYTKLLFNHTIAAYCTDSSIDVVQNDLNMLTPLEQIKPIEYTTEFKLHITKEEKDSFRSYMEKEGINFNYPVLLIGVTTKLLHKKWNEESMILTLKKVLDEYDNIQMIFNYAPGVEEDDARNIYKKLGEPKNVKINIQASSLRQLAALCANCSFYFGNEGGTRHIAQALGVPSFAIYSPSVSKTKWLPSNSVFAKGISVDDVLSKHEQIGLTYEQCFDSITPEEVYKQLNPILLKLKNNQL